MYKRNDFISLVVYTGYGGSEPIFFSAMDARFLHISINYQKKAFYHLNDYTVYFAQLCRTMNILLRTQTHIIEVVY